MKKILSFIALIILFSCQKEAQFCWDCTVKETTISPGATTTKTSSRTKCDMSSREIELFEQGSTSGNTTTTATCIKQQ